MPGKKLVSGVIAFVFIAIAAAPAVVDAQGSGGQGLEIAPPLLDLKADPGQVLKAQIRVRNVTQSKLVTTAQFEDFVAQGEEGQPKILLNPNEKSPYSLKEWLSTPNSVTLNPGQRETINLTITVPKNASPGGHYGLVRFTGVAPELQDSGVSLSASVGTLLLVNVSGNVTQSAKVAELYTSQNGKRKSLFEYGPIGVTTRVQNTGNIHIQPKGTIQITDIFGRNIYIGQLNESTRNVLPGSIRKFDNNYNKKLLFGPLKVKADLVYGTDNQIASATKTIWVIPYKLIAIVILAILLLVVILKGYNRYIIKRASTNNAQTKSKKNKNKKNKP